MCCFCQAEDCIRSLVRSRGLGDVYKRQVQGPLVNRHRPSVDVLFRSVARFAGQNAIGVIMTGMGRDGSEGLQAVKRCGGKIIAEHQSTSIVYGMPKAAFETGQVDLVVPLPEISKAIVKMLLQ